MLWYTYYDGAPSSSKPNQNCLSVDANNQTTYLQEWAVSPSFQDSLLPKSTNLREKEGLTTQKLRMTK